MNMYNLNIKQRIFLIIIFCLCVMNLISCKKEIDSDVIAQSNVEQQESAVNNSDSVENMQNGLQVEISGELCIVAKIQNEDAYKEFIDRLDRYTSYTMLRLRLLGTDTVIYLDELLKLGNFEYVTIENGGRVLLKDAEEFRQNSTLREVDLLDVSSIDEKVFKNFPTVERVFVNIDNRCDENFPLKDLQGNMDCTDVIIFWDYQKANSMKGFSMLNAGDYSYASYVVCEQSEPESYRVYIIVKDRETQGERYFDILSIPQEKPLEITRTEEQRIVLKDINFDGYEDIVFCEQDIMWSAYLRCYAFLWNPIEERFQFNETAPFNFEHVDEKRRRITYLCSGSAFDDDYYIYEYNNNEFIEKRLEVRFFQTEPHVIWQYFEENIMTKKLELIYHEEDDADHAIYEENGKIVEEKLYDKDAYYADIGKEYFPEFDFYTAG